ncbi:hypothetical protein A2W24_06910 [Microgenomates group bacterium RBG_16_45_19]|nr:MAG: hypothetical protein A2W24_06910 [Microgenomates group bacterium RBG_16_45_19]
MQQIVSITDQGQLTIPKQILGHFGIKRRVKAIIELQDKTIIVRPKRDFWDLGGALTGKIRLTDKQLKQARVKFTQDWADKV